MNTKPLLLLAAFPLLAGCGALVGSLVPPQSFENPANLNGATLSTSSPLAIQRVGGSLRYDTRDAGTSFNDLTYPKDVPFGMRPHAASIQASLTEAVVSGPCLALAPESFVLRLDSFSVSVWDAGNQAGAATLSGTPGLEITATRSSSGPTGTVYTLEEKAFSIRAGGDVTDRAINILTAGGLNDASASALISADQDALAGCSLTFKLGNTSVTLSNFS